MRTNFLEGQEITGKMRSILIDWLCQVHHRFHLLQETLYLTVAIIDRFLQVVINLFPLHRCQPLRFFLIVTDFRLLQAQNHSPFKYHCDYLDASFSVKIV